MQAPKPRREWQMETSAFFLPVHGLKFMRGLRQKLLHPSKASARTKIQQETLGTIQHGACKWLKQTAPAPCVLRTDQGNVIMDRSALTKELYTCWSQIFGVNTEGSDLHNFWQVFGPYMPPCSPPPELPKITCAEIKKAALQMNGKATGLDGIAAKQISLLPQPALIRLAQLLSLFERRSCWPDGLRHLRMVFIPQQKDKDIPKAAQVRPISIAPIIYRLWGQIRLKHCREFLTSALSPHQAGGCGGPDVTSLLLSFRLEFPKKDFPCVAALDFTKAFDSCDFELSLLVMQHLGVPSRILGLST